MAGNRNLIKQNYRLAGNSCPPEAIPKPGCPQPGTVPFSAFPHLFGFSCVFSLISASEDTACQVRSSQLQLGAPGAAWGFLLLFQQRSECWCVGPKKSQRKETGRNSETWSVHCTHRVITVTLHLAWGSTFTACTNYRSRILYPNH